MGGEVRAVVYAARSVARASSSASNAAPRTWCTRNSPPLSRDADAALEAARAVVDVVVAVAEEAVEGEEALRICAVTAARRSRSRDEGEGEEEEGAECALRLRARGMKLVQKRTEPNHIADQKH